MKFTMGKLKTLIEKSIDYGDTGHSLLDQKYDDYTKLVAHINPYYKLFYLIAQEFKPEFCVELGSYRATAAAHLAVGNPNGKVVTIDIHKDEASKADHIETKRTASLISNLDFIHGWTVPVEGYSTSGVVDQVKAYQKPIDLIFIDAWHKEEIVKLEWDTYTPLMADNGLIICDDIFNAAGTFENMEEWWDSINYPKFLNGGVHPGIPMGFIHWSTEKPKRKPQKSKTPKPQKR